MDRATAEKRFQESDRLFRNKQYEASLKVLDELDVFYPNNRRVRCAKAKCYGAMGCTNHAVDICDELLANHGYERAAQLKEKLLQANARVVPNFVVDLDPAFTQLPEEVDMGVGFPWLYALMLGLFGLVGLVLLYAGLRMVY